MAHLAQLLAHNQRTIYATYTLHICACSTTCAHDSIMWDKMHPIYIYIFIFTYKFVISVKYEVILLMEKILHHLENSVNNGINYGPQLVQDFFHQEHVTADGFLLFQSWGQTLLGAFGRWWIDEFEGWNVHWKGLGFGKWPVEKLMVRNGGTWAPL